MVDGICYCYKSSLPGEPFLLLDPRWQQRELQVSALTQTSPLATPPQLVPAQLLGLAQPTHQHQQPWILTQPFLEQDVHMVFLADADEEAHCRQVPLQENLDFLDDFDCFGTGDLGETVVLLGGNEVAGDLARLLDDACPQLRLVEAVVGVPAWRGRYSGRWKGKMYSPVFVFSRRSTYAKGSSYFILRSKPEGRKSNGLMSYCARRAFSFSVSCCSCSNP